MNDKIEWCYMCPECGWTGKEEDIELWISAWNYTSQEICPECWKRTTKPVFVDVHKCKDDEYGT